MVMVQDKALHVPLEWGRRRTGVMVTHEYLRCQALDWAGSQLCDDLSPCFQPVCHTTSPGCRFLSCKVELY